MQAFTTVVQVDPDTVSKLVNFIGDLYNEKSSTSAFISECQKFIASSQVDGVLLKILEQKDLIFQTDSDKGDLKSIFII